MSDKEITWFMTALAKAWSSLDPAAVASLHDQPCLLGTFKGGRVLADAAAATAYFDKLLRFYRKRGVARIGIDEMTIATPRPLALPVFSTVQAQWRLWTADGLPFLGFHATHMLRRAPEGWRVHATANHDELQRFAARKGA